MRLIILGSGTLASGQNRNPSGYLIRHRDKTGLLDCGPGVLKQLKKYNQNILDIDTIFLSHFHLDHCADVFPLMLNRFLLDSKANRNLTIAGPPGLTEWFNLQASLQGKWLQQEQPSLLELLDTGFKWAGIEVVAHPNEHTASSIAYRFWGRQHLFYSGDTDYFTPLVSFAYGTHIALIECSMPDELKTEGHLTASETGRFAKEAQVSKLVLTHLYPQNDTADLKQRVAASFDGKIIIAEDFMDLEV